MTRRKDESPKSQKTLLSFFKPKTDESATTGTRDKTPSSVSPVGSKKHMLEDDTPTLNDSSAPRDRSTWKRARTNKKPISNPVKDVRNVEESLFPDELETHVPHLAQELPSPPPSSTALMPIHQNDSSPSPGPAKKQAPVKTSPFLSQFGYQASDGGMDQENRETIDVEEQKAKDELREKFLKKLGNLAAPKVDQDVGQRLTARRRRIIVPESDEEDTEATAEQEAVTDKQSSAKTSSRRPKARAATSQADEATDEPEEDGSKKTPTKYTPLEKQFIEIKKQNPDAILCIEVGYKFRFFGRDAEIASRELCIAHFMDHNFYTASIPIHRLDVHVRRLVHAGYKVGVVRQMETAALKSVGDNKSAPFTRKLTNLYTKATFIESLDQDEEQFQANIVGSSPSSQYLMGIYEQPQGGSGADEKVKVAMIAVQPATGDVIYDEFIDGHFRNELETRLLHIQPAEVIVPMEAMSKATEKLLAYLTGSSQHRSGFSSRSQDDVRIERTKEFVRYEVAFKLVSEFYSTSLKEETKDTNTGSAKQFKSEALLKTVLNLPRNLIITLSAMISHMKEFGLASVFQLSKYFECFTSRSHMLLNGNTLSNLEIYRNQTDWTTRGSLFSILDYTVTGFGKRLLKKWVGKPLVDRKALQDRVDAVEEILHSDGKNTHLKKVLDTLNGLMDLEKGVCRIHYGKSSPREFLTIMQTFQRVSEIIPASERTKKHPHFGLKSPMLNNLIGSLSSAAEEIRYFLNMLREQAAGKDDKLTMFRDDTIVEKWPEIQEHRDNIAMTEDKLAEHLLEVRKLLREPRLEFSSVSGIDYLIEVKNKDVVKVPPVWVKISGTKQVSRFHTQEAIQLISSKAQHQERLSLACDRAFAEFKNEFSERYEVFRDLVQNLAMLDCLFSLAKVASLPGYVKPEYVDDQVPLSTDTEDAQQLTQETDSSRDGDDEQTSSFQPKKSGSHRLNSKVTLDITNGRHPMVEQLLEPGDFVPNDVWFGTHATTGIDEKTIVLTGPNMGGKSCYIRMVALLCIMAQIGSYLPADSARVSLLDAVFTRMGASDNLFGHESTFMVELQETSDILKMATPRSLVILDELGRGTSTLDGVAIAYAVLKHVVSHHGSIILFVTHYPSLSDVAKEFPEGVIRNYHMSFMASTTESGPTDQETDQETDPTTNELDNASGVHVDDMDIVFLYKLVPGVSMKSYGLNVARMAKLPMPLITNAKVKSKELETILERRVELHRQSRSGDGAVSGTQGQLLHFARQIYECSTNDDAQDLVQSLRAWSVPS
ncbi:MAG: muts domain V-domain-containing protein [Benniella sp.]|nr:MAG: muts domain V-domain-containing protein [Benniella sp.]